jgi:hypothetical protein
VQTLGLLNFKVTGNFEADLRVEGINPASTPAVKSLVVGGVLNGSEMRISGNVSKIQLGAISGSKILVGTDVVPASLADFNYARTIANLIITGVTGVDLGVVDSEIAAARMGTVKITTNIDGASGDGQFGLFADKIASYHRGMPAAPTYLNLDAAREVDPVGNYAVTVLA